MPTFALTLVWADMEQNLLTDIELNVHELRCLMDSFSKTPTDPLSMLLLRSIERMRTDMGRLELEVKSVALVEEEKVEPEHADDSLSKHPDMDGLTPERVEVWCEEPKEPAVEEVIAESKVCSTTVGQKETYSSVLGERIKKSADLKKMISLNDSFRFSRELFGGNTDLMNRTLEQISVMSAYGTSVAFLSTRIKVDKDNETMTDFLELLNKYFDQSAS